MKLQRSTLILVLLAIGLAGLVFGLDRSGPNTPPGATIATATPIFTFQEDQIQAVTVRTPQQTLELVKLANPDPNAPRKSGWQLQVPVVAIANDAAVAYLLNLLATAKSSSTITVPTNRLAEFGLDVPLARVEVKLADRRAHRLILGQPNFNQSALYAQADPPGPTATEQQILLVPIEFENAVRRPLSEWQQPDLPTPNSPGSPLSSPSPTPNPKTNPTVRPDQR